MIYLRNVEVAGYGSAENATGKPPATAPAGRISMYAYPDPIAVGGGTPADVALPAEETPLFDSENPETGRM